MSLEKFLCVYLLVINVITFLIFGFDKMKAITHQWRIPEKTLLLFSFMGGCLGAWMAMLLFRHKIKDRSFLPYIILITIVWIIVIIVFLPNILKK